MKKRLASGLLQKDVAKIIGVSEDSVTYWENGRAKPQIHFYPAIIAFLGYYPFDHEIESIAGKLKQVRFRLGHDYSQMGTILGVNGSTVRLWEQRKAMPKASFNFMIQSLWATLPEQIRTHSFILKSSENETSK